MACEVGAQLISLINALHMMVIVVNGLWNEEVFEELALKNRA
jgi:hypothetical protein